MAAAVLGRLAAGSDAELAPLLFSSWPLVVQARGHEWKAIVARVLKQLAGAPPPREVVVYLRFLTALLANMVSGKERVSRLLCGATLSDLLVHRDDEVALCALELVVATGESPPPHLDCMDVDSVDASCLHKFPKLVERLMPMAQGWGRLLEPAPGACDLHFQFFADSEAEQQDAAGPLQGRGAGAAASSHSGGGGTTAAAEAEAAPAPTAAPVPAATTTTRIDVLRLHSFSETPAELLDQLVTHYGVPARHHEALLCRIRVAQELGSAEGRLRAMRRRLLAICALLHTQHESDDMHLADQLVAYFDRNQDLVPELVEIARKPRADVPHALQMSALQLLCALVDDRSGGVDDTRAGIIQTEADVQQALGIARGARQGAMSSMLRRAVAQLMATAGGYGTTTQGAAVPGASSAAAAAASAARPSGASSMAAKVPTAAADTHDDASELDAMGIGLAFVAAAAPPSEPGAPRISEVADREGLEWVAGVFSLVRAVVSLRQGSAVLSDAGLIPALLGLLPLTRVSLGRELDALATARVFVLVQAFQALDIAYETHPSAAALFRQLDGVPQCVALLHDLLPEAHTDAEAAAGASEMMPIAHPRRMLIHALVGVLSSAFNPGTNGNLTNSNVFLQEADLPLVVVMLYVARNLDACGPDVFASVCSLLTDMINSDPSCVTIVHTVGLAGAFCKTLQRPNLPVHRDILLVVPPLLGALCLTTGCAEKIIAQNPLPSLFCCFYTPEFVMPLSPCLDGIAHGVGAGIDELLRHVPKLTDSGIKLFVTTIQRIAELGAAAQEKLATETDRTTVRNYVGHIATLLEPTFSKPEHVRRFVEVGGIPALLKLCPFALPSTSEFLSGAGSERFDLHPSMQALTTTMHAIGAHRNQGELMDTVTQVIRHALAGLEKRVGVVMAFAEGLDRAADSSMELGESGRAFALNGILDIVPDVRVPGGDDIDYANPPASLGGANMLRLTSFARAVAAVEWLADIVAVFVRIAHMSQPLGTLSAPWVDLLCPEGGSDVIRSLEQLDCSLHFEIARQCCAAAAREKKSPATPAVPEPGLAIIAAADNAAPSQGDAGSAQQTSVQASEASGDASSASTNVVKDSKEPWLRDAAASVLNKALGTVRHLLVMFGKATVVRTRSRQHQEDGISLSPYAARFKCVVSNWFQRELQVATAALTGDTVRPEVACAFLRQIVDGLAICLMGERRNRNSGVINTQLLFDLVESNALSLLMDALSLTTKLSCGRAKIFAAEGSDGGTRKEALTVLAQTVVTISAVASLLRRMIMWKPVSSSSNYWTRALSKQRTKGFDADEFMAAVRGSVVRKWLSVWQFKDIAWLPVSVTLHLVSFSQCLLAEHCQAAERKAKPGSRSSASVSGIAALLRNTPAGNIWSASVPAAGTPFEPSETLVEGLVAMGFARPHVIAALRSTRSNREDAAIEWLVTNPPPASQDPQAAPGEADPNSDEEAEAREQEEEERLKEAVQMSLGANSEEATASSSNVTESTKGKEAAAFEQLSGSMTQVCISLVARARADTDPAGGKSERSALQLVTSTTAAHVQSLIYLVADVVGRILSRPDDEERESAFRLLKQSVLKAASARPIGNELCHLAHVLALLLHREPRLRELLASAEHTHAIAQLITVLQRCASERVDSNVDEGNWVPACLLIMDAMAQPVFPEKIESRSLRPPREGNPFDRGDSKGDHSVSNRRSSSSSADRTAAGSSIVSGDCSTAINASNDSTRRRLTSHLSQQDKCALLDTCVHLLKAVSAPSPAVLHAVIQLCVRLTRTPDGVERFLKPGVVDALIAMPQKSQFPGQAALVGILFRHTLEDDSTLASRMETEIRASFLRHRGTTITPSAFLRALTPVACRDQETFLKSCASVLVRAPNGQLRIRRQVNVPTAAATVAQSQSQGEESVPKLAPSSSSVAAPKGDKRPTSVSTVSYRHSHSVTEVITKLVTHLCNVRSVGPLAIDAEETLLLLTDLVIAFPKTVSLIHRYKMVGPIAANREKGSFVWHVIHELMPQPRPDLSLHRDKDQQAPSAESLARLRVSQQGARLLLALCARAGEGRRRIVRDLVAALQETDARENRVPSSHVSDAWATLNWTMLVLSLMAPRLDRTPRLNRALPSTASLSWEIIRTMLDSGMIEALLSSLRRLELAHPAASLVASATVQALEVLTRTSVAETLFKHRKAVRDASGTTVEVSAGPVEDSMIDDSFSHLQDTARHRDSADGGVHGADREAAMVRMMEEEHALQQSERGMSDLSGSENDGEDIHIANIAPADDDSSSGSDDDAVVIEMEHADGESERDDDDHEDDDDEDGEDGEDDDENDEDDDDDDEEDDDSSGGDRANRVLEMAMEEGARVMLETEDGNLVEISQSGGSSSSDDDDDREEEDNEGGTGSDADMDGEDEVFMANRSGSSIDGGSDGDEQPEHYAQGWEMDSGTDSAGFVEEGEDAHAQLMNEGEAVFTGSLSDFGALIGGRHGQGNPNAMVEQILESIINNGDGGGEHGGEMQLGNFGAGIAQSIRMLMRNGGRENTGNAMLSRIPMNRGSTHGSAEQQTRPVSHGLLVPMHAVAAPSGSSSSGGAQDQRLRSRLRDYDNPRSHRNSRAVTSGTRWTDDANGTTSEHLGFSLSLEEELLAAVPEELPQTAEESESKSEDVCQETKEGDREPPAADAAVLTQADAVVRRARSDSWARQIEGMGASPALPPERAPAAPLLFDLGSLRRATANEGDAADRSTCSNDAGSSAAGGSATSSSTPAAEAAGSSTAAADDGGVDAASPAGTCAAGVAAPTAAAATANTDAEGSTDAAGPACPPGTDPSVFAALPPELQQQVIDEYETQQLAEADATAVVQSAGLDMDPVALAALPDDERRETLARQSRQSAAAGAAALGGGAAAAAAAGASASGSGGGAAAATRAVAEDTTAASFITSLPPDLQQEILLTADEATLQSLPPALAAEAQRLRDARGHPMPRSPPAEQPPSPRQQSLLPWGRVMLGQGSEAQRQRDQGREQDSKLRLEKRRRDDDPPLLLARSSDEANPADRLASSLRLLVRMLYMRQAVDMGLLQTLLRNLCMHESTALVLISCLYAALKGRAPPTPAARPQLVSPSGSLVLKKITIDTIASAGRVGAEIEDEFPPLQMIGCTSGGSAFDLPQAASTAEQGVARTPPTVATRALDLMTQLARHSPFFVYIMLGSQGAEQAGPAADVMVVKLIRLMGEHMFRSSRTHLTQLVQLIECATAPLAKVRKSERAAAAAVAAAAAAATALNVDEVDEGVSSSSEAAGSASAAGGAEEREKKEEKIENAKKEERPKSALRPAESVEIPRVKVPSRDLRLLTSTLTLDHCTDSLFQRLTKVVLHLAVVRENRESLVTEIAATVTVFSAGSIRSLVTLEEELRRAVAEGMSLVGVLAAAQTDPGEAHTEQGDDAKLLRVLQTIASLTSDAASAPGARTALSLQTALAGATEQLRQLWDKLTTCLRVVSLHAGLIENKHDETSESDSEGGTGRGGARRKSKGKGKERLGSGGLLLRSPRATSRRGPRTPRGTMGPPAAPSAAPVVAPSAVVDEPAAAAAQSPILSALQARFLPLVEAFFVVSAAQDALEQGPAAKIPYSSPGPQPLMRVASLQSCASSPLPSPAGGDAAPARGAELVAFVEANKALLNGIVRQHPSLIDAKGSLAALASMSRCCAHLDFDNKQVLLRSRLRKLSHANHRRPGHLRIAVRRDHVLEDSYAQIAPKSVEELRGKINISFRGEEGVDAGGLTREWLTVLFRQVFDPNLALFRQSADSPTMQPNPLSYVNSEHLNYFKFIGRVVGKAVHDGHLIDAFFTRSFYKHILNKPLHYTDLVSIDPVRVSLALACRFSCCCCCCCCHDDALPPPGPHYTTHAPLLLISTGILQKPVDDHGQSARNAVPRACVRGGNARIWADQACGSEA